MNEKRRSPGDKLKNETTSAEAMREKLRHGKKNTQLTNKEMKAKNKLQRQGRQKIYLDTAVAAKARREVIQNKDDNAGTHALDAGLEASEILAAKIAVNSYRNK